MPTTTRSSTPGGPPCRSSKTVSDGRHNWIQQDGYQAWLYSAAGHGSPETKTVEVAPRQAACSAPPPGAARERVPGLPPAEAAAPRLPELQDLPRARSRASESTGALRTMNLPVRVAVDAMGGDRGSEEIVAGALEAASPTVVPVLYGPP